MRFETAGSEIVEVPDNGDIVVVYGKGDGTLSVSGSFLMTPSATDKVSITTNTPISATIAPCFTDMANKFPYLIFDYTPPPIDFGIVTPENSAATGDPLGGTPDGNDIGPVYDAITTYSGGGSLYTETTDANLLANRTIDITNLLDINLDPITDIYIRTYMYLPTQVLDNYSGLLWVGNMQVGVASGQNNPSKFMLSNLSVANDEKELTTDIPFDSWFRMELKIGVDRYMTLKIFLDPESLVATETITSNDPFDSAWLNSPQIDLFRFVYGNENQRYLDEISVGTQDWIGIGTGDFWNNSFNTDIEPTGLADIYLTAYNTRKTHIDNGDVFNDNFSQARTLVGVSDSDTVLGIENATLETGEQAKYIALHEGAGLSLSAPEVTLWWKWTAPLNGIVNVDTFNSYYVDEPTWSGDAAISAYTGTNINDLVLVEGIIDVDPSTVELLSANQQGLETGETGFTAVTGFWGRDVDWSPRTGAGQLYWNAVTDIDGDYDTGGANGKVFTNITPGQWLEFNMWVKHSEEAGYTCMVQILFLDGSNNYVSSVDGPTLNLNGGWPANVNDFQSYTVGAIVPATAASAKIRLIANGANAFADDLSLTVADATWSAGGSSHNLPVAAGGDWVTLDSLVYPYYLANGSPENEGNGGLGDNQWNGHVMFNAVQGTVYYFGVSQSWVPDPQTEHNSTTVNLSLTI